MPEGAYFDPLKIFYHPILETDDVRDVTPFQGFSVSWRPLLWALEMIAQLPADVLERASDIDEIVAQRMGGFRLLSWAPLNIGALESMSIDALPPFLVLFSGERACAARVAAWRARQERPVLHISPIEVEGRIDPAAFTSESLRDFCAQVINHSPRLFSEVQRAAAETALHRWAEPRAVSSGLKERSHNITLPNYSSLRRSGRTVEPAKPFIGSTEKEYTGLILETAKAVVDIRNQIGIRRLHALTLLRPALVLTEPALYRMNYKPLKVKDRTEERIARQTLRLIQKQRGLCNEDKSEFVRELMKSRIAQAIIESRSVELQTFTAGLSIHAAQTAAAVVRLSPSINHVFPALSAYAQSNRSSNLAARLKARRLFDSIQSGLQEAVGHDRIAFIEEVGGPLKIVADAPLEWLPVGNLPLCLRHDCCRINATPGNLLMALLTEPVTITFKPEALQKVLIVTSFTEDDPLRDILTKAIDAVRERWEGKVDVIFKKANTPNQFIEILNSYDGSILIFDGHGADNATDPVGKLMIGKEAVDVWELRDKVRVPPIVILSACDTHDLDASSHATVGNGFLFLGARTVLATLLPVNALKSAFFVARLIYRLADFIPAALSTRKRVLNWTEIMAGMLRMAFASELLDELIGPPAPEGSPRATLQLAANIDINAREDEELVHELVSQHRERTKTLPGSYRGKSAWNFGAL